MKTFVIKDEYKKLIIGYLLYFETSKRFLIELQDDLAIRDVPIFFDHFVEEGITTIDPDWSRRYVEARIVPRDRQNIKSILRDAGLKEYDSFQLLALSRGRCSQDDCSVMLTEELPDWLILRRRKSLVSAIPLSDFRALLIYEDHSIQLLNLKEALEKDKSLRVLLSREQDFREVKLEADGRLLCFSEDRYLLSNELYGQGTVLPISMEDLDEILIRYVTDALALSEQLQVSRQYINKYLSDKNIEPIRKSGKNYLYTLQQVKSLVRES